MTKRKEKKVKEEVAEPVMEPVATVPASSIEEEVEPETSEMPIDVVSAPEEITTPFSSDDNTRPELAEAPEEDVHVPKSYELEPACDCSHKVSDVEYLEYLTSELEKTHAMIALNPYENSSMPRYLRALSKTIQQLRSDIYLIRENS